VSEGEHDNPRLVNLIALEDIKRIHGGDAHAISLVSKRKAGQLCGELLRRSFVASVGDRNQFRIGVGRLKCLG
jgi:hypothetical protein